MWKPIPGFEGYEVSERGSVRSLPREVHHWRGGIRSLVGRDLALIPNRGYLVVRLSHKGKATTLGAHQVVAMAFLGDPDGNVVNHINGIKTDNRVENLEYVTNRENVLHSYRTGLLNNRGEANGRAILTNEAVHEIRAYPESASNRSVAAATGAPIHQVRKIRQRQQWTHISG